MPLQTLFLGKHMRDQAASNPLSFSPGILFHLSQSAKLRKSPQDYIGTLLNRHIFGELVAPFPSTS
jgi:hypothetical protein